MNKVAIVQAELAPDLASGIEATDRLTGDAARDGAALVAFPETWLPGYPIWLDVCRDVALWDHAPVKAVFGEWRRKASLVPRATRRRAANAARDSAVTVVMGVIERVTGSGAGNAVQYDSHIRARRRAAQSPSQARADIHGTNGLGPGRRAAAYARRNSVRQGRRTRLLGALDASRPSRDARVGRRHSCRPVADRARDASGREPAVRVRGTLFVLAVGSLMRASALPPELEPHPAKVTRPDQ